MLIALLKEMFSKMVLEKDASLIPHYYHKDFMLYANGHEMTFEDYLVFHEKVYASPIRYEVAYDEDTWVEDGGKIAGRVWITTSMPQEAPHEIEVVFIAQYKEEKLYRLWELTHPDWSKLSMFSEPAV